MADGAIDIRRVARTLSLVENRRPESQAVLRDAYAMARHIPVVGVTGPPGAGKSTLLDRLALHWAEKGEKLAVIAVDPSSPFTGGAVLGDRFRMDRASAHPRVFVRSLASRGHVGGLSRAVQDVVTVVASLGFDRVIVETVGSGQADVEVATLADCVVVVSVPGLGDQLQAAKAGILEIGDVYAVNKRDLPGADTVAGHLEANLDLIYPGSPGVNQPDGNQVHDAMRANASVQRRHGGAGSKESFWRPRVLRVSASSGADVQTLSDAVDEFLAWQRATGREEERRAERFRSHILRLAAGRLMAQSLPEGASASLPILAEAVTQGAMTPDEAAERLLAALLAAWQDRPRC
ncbi:MAG: methylmalonyl Co-A mutase-associated GTPase MeaB [Sulfuricaulis sp.]|nr:methylmalonyl Co-A mutase-associated GTPase MeaB [Sulfuricaulis sp.]